MKNQFRSLDDDEIEFLDSVLESTRSKEAEVKKETRAQLEAFRQRQEDAEKAAKVEETSEAPPVSESWSFGARKRKKGREKEAIGGVKLRKASRSGEDRERDVALTKEQGRKRTKDDSKASKEGKASDEGAKPEVKAARETVEAKSTESSVSSGTPSLGLAAYLSDEDD